MSHLTSLCAATAVVVAALISAGCESDNRTSRSTSTGMFSAGTSQDVPEGYGYVSRHVVTVDQTNANIVRLSPLMTIATVDAIENSTNVKAVTRMTDYKGAYEADVPRVSPDGQTVLYQLREEYGNINLWTMASETGTNKIRNTEGDNLNFYGAWSTKGDKIIFSSNRTDQNSHLWEIKAYGGGGGLRRITESREADFWVHEAPTANDILAYTRYQIGVPTIWTYSRKTYLSTQLRVGRQPQISPDGLKIVYTVFDEQEGHWNIWTMNMDGSQPTQLTSNDADNITPSWHPSSKWIIFASNKGSVSATSRNSKAVKNETRLHNFDIWMMHANGEFVSQLTVNGSDDDNPVFSPDAKTFYFSSNRGHALEDLGKIGTGRDVWRATITDDVVAMDIAQPKDAAPAK
ncbi:MAG: PD40 domain-containing protein [Planctomycetes bacterium]|nr:PD40 domain-containing protein [Planctomycetota bacterium]